MPIHLPAISRRKFLTRSLAAGAGLAVAPQLLAETGAAEPDSWALLADLHLAADRKQLGRGINMAEHFTSVSSELRSLSAGPPGFLSSATALLTVARLAITRRYRSYWNRSEPRACQFILRWETMTIASGSGRC